MALGVGVLAALIIVLNGDPSGAGRGRGTVWQTGIESIGAGPSYNDGFVQCGLMLEQLKFMKDR